MSNKFANDIQVKVSLLGYLHSLILLMMSDDFVNSSDTRLAVSRIITWTTEPKSVEVRKVRKSYSYVKYLISSVLFRFLTAFKMHQELVSHRCFGSPFAHM